jgi:hypothetical protein
MSHAGDSKDENPHLDSAQTSAPDYKTIEASKILCHLEGFWIAITPVDPDPVDQTFQSIGERARFYSGSLPKTLRERLAALNQLGSGREAELTEPFARAYDSVISLASAQSKPLARRKARLDALGGARATPRDGCGLSFIHHQPEHGLHWGAIDILFDSVLLLPSHHKAFWRASFATQAACRKLCFKTSTLFLDAIEAAWGIGPAIAHHQRDEERIHWSEDYAPSCQDEPSDIVARSALEAVLISDASLSALRSPRRTL